MEEEDEVIGENFKCCLDLDRNCEGYEVMVFVLSSWFFSLG